MLILMAMAKEKAVADKIKRVDKAYQRMFKKFEEASKMVDQTRD